ncbi:MAG TPA: hypothetical protein VFB21_09410 [Chthonomonadaceae bacterium]|nr:hypothetical protein [Chthonomonadaceae bacterium]
MSGQKEAREPRSEVRARRMALKALLSHAVLLLVGLFFALPFYWLVSTAIKEED